MPNDNVQSFTDTNEARRNLRGTVPPNGENYKLAGLDLDPESDWASLNVRQGELFVVDSGTGYYCQVAERTGDDRLTLTNNATNEIYYDVSAEEIKAVTGSAPSQPRLKIGEVDTSANTVDESFNQDPDQTFTSVSTEKTQINDQTTRNISVPSDYSTLATALENSKQELVPAGTVIEISIESGHTVSGGVLLEDGDFGHITITSEDATVSVDGLGAGEKFLNLLNSNGPKLDALFDMQGSGGEGVNVENGSSITIESGAGVVNAGNIGLRVIDRSDVTGAGADFSSASSSGCRVDQASTLNLNGIDLSGAGLYGITVNRSSNANIANGDVSNVSDSAIRARSNAKITAVDATATGAGTDAIYADEGSVVDAEGVTATGAGRYGAWANGGKIELAGSADVSNASNNCIHADDGGRVVAPGVTANGAGQSNVTAEGADYVNVANASLQNPQTHCIEAREGSTVQANGATATGGGQGGFGHGVLAREKAQVNAQGADASGAASADIRAVNGGEINANGCTTTNGSPDVGDTNLSSLNSMTSDGYIYG